MFSFQFDWKGVNLPVPQATLHYVGGVDPALRWEKRGLKSHEKDREAERRLQTAISQADDFIQTEKGRGRLNDFMDGALSIFHDLLENPNWIEEHFPEHEFVFIAGPMRTGGTYLLTEMMEVLDIEYKKLPFRMVHDSIPTPEYLSGISNPKSWLPLMFECAQYLEWVKREYPGHTVIKKRIGMGHCLNVFKELFEDRAEYIVPIRHPAGIAKSGTELLETFHQDTPDPDKQGWRILHEHRSEFAGRDWETMSYNQRVLSYWELYYRDVAMNAPVEGLSTVVFAEESEQAIQQFAERRSCSADPSSFEPTDREFSDFWNSSEVDRAFENVRQQWDLQGLEFPETIPKL